MEKSRVPAGRAWAAYGRASARNAAGDPAVRALVAVVEWQRTITDRASLLVIAFGLFRLANGRHPRALARISPAQLGLWSFAVALSPWRGADAGAIYLGLCREADSTEATKPPARSSTPNLGTAVLVAVVHAPPMIAAGGCCALASLTAISVSSSFRLSWFNLDTIWAVSLILVGAIALALNMA
jgi:hypothetical protein